MNWRLSSANGSLCLRGPGKSGRCIVLEVSEAQESLYLLNRGGLRPVQDTLNLQAIHAYMALGDNETKERDSLYVELTLLCLNKEVVA